MKVPFFDKKILRTFYAFLGGISVITSIVFLFVDIDNKAKLPVGLVILGIILLVYIGLWVHAKKRQSINLKINTSEVEVKFGDLFAEAADLKVIAFNEYFDTIVDDKIIARGSLHGQYIEKFFKDNVSALDSFISSDAYLPVMFAGEDVDRPVGKKTRYKLGTICQVADYLLIAFSRFDGTKAYLEINDLLSCLMNFWNEVDRVYAGRTIALPVLGSGLTRRRGYENISDQELLELIIWTFKVSRVKFTYPSKVKIVVWNEKRDKINLLALKDLET